jgi:ketosteroid isomerase-like protein
MTGSTRRMVLQGAAGAALAAPAVARTDTARQEILAVVAAMQAAWNRGDFRGYMDGFWNPGVVFVSGGRIQDGWQGTLDHYVRDYGGSADRRGEVRFFDMNIDVLAPDAAMLVGHFTLGRPERALKGINTRLFRKIGGRWVIAMNHVSSYETGAAA